MIEATKKTKAMSANRLPLPVRQRHGSVYMELREALRASVLAVGQPGDRIPSERELARQFGVSPVTISRALQELQTEGAIERIVGKGTFISRLSAPPIASKSERAHDAGGTRSGNTRSGGARDDNARPDSLDAWPGQSQRGGNAEEVISPERASRFTWIVSGLDAPDVDPGVDEFWSYRVTSRVERSVQSAGGRTVVTNSNTVSERDIATVVENKVADGVDSIVFVVDSPDANWKAWARALLEAQRLNAGRLSITQVLLGNSARFPLNAVRFNGEHGSYLATSHLLQLGHREIAFIAPDLQTSWIGDRILGFRRALEVPDGLESLASDKRILCGADVPREFSNHPWEWIGRDMAAILFAAAKSSKANRFSAVVAANDGIAKGVIEAAREHGIHVPDDLSVVGFDDMRAGSTLGLTTIHPPLEQMGDAALQLHQMSPSHLAASHQGYIEVVLSPTLVVRSSTRAFAG